MASFGQDLKRERETRGISLREIADSTRIGLRYLEALEGDHLERIPRQFFLRAIIRSYAKAVGLDEAQVIKKYDDMVQFGEQLEYRKSAPEAAPARSAQLRWKRALILVLLLILAGGLFYVFVLAPRRTGRLALQPTGTPAPQTRSGTAPWAAAKAVPAPAAPAPSQPQKPILERVSGLVFEASFSENTWLRVYADGRRVHDGTKRAGDTLSVKAEREIVLNLGNAGGMRFTLNGRPARPLGPRGAVMTNIRINPGNYTSFLLPGEGG